MDDSLRPSPGLNMEHGFVRRIEQNQHIREQQCKDDLSKRLEIAKMARKVGMPVKTSKPTLEIYRPPSLRGPNAEPNAGHQSSLASASIPTRNFGTSPTLVAEAPPYVAPAEGAATTATGSAGPPEVRIVEVTGLSNMPRSTVATTSTSSSSRAAPSMAISAASSSSATVTPHISKVHFQLQVPTSNSGGKIKRNDSISSIKSNSINYGLKRSKSLGAGDLKMSIPSEFDLGTFPPDVQSVIKRAVDDPNKLSSRQLMELVRHIFNRVIENSRYAEPAARLFFTIIEKEKTETFLESTLNSCREFYNERNRFLRNFSSMSGDGFPNHRWIAYVTFMYEMYARLKTRQRSPQLAGTSALTAGPMLLSLLGECCHVFLRPPSLFNFAEIECLFFILTSIGRDLENEMPQRMKLIMAAVRDAFTNPSIAPFISKSLLQLIELQASNWQLTTPAVTYYYPGSQERK